jgi:superfamily II DNA or RNA helicase
MPSIRRKPQAQTSHAAVSDSGALLRYAKNLDAYISDGIKDHVLRPHQRRVFDDVSRFLHSGASRGYIEMPTGTGKTVLFVSLAEAFSYNDPHPPRILVVTPTRDLVRQTIGGPLNQKGFAGFAPGIEVGTFYSETQKKERDNKTQVTVTTYASLRKLAKTPVVTTERGIKMLGSKNRVNEEYDIIFFDEAHRAQGVGTKDIIASLNDDKMVIGFTATPDYNAERKLETILPVMIHKLDIEESIEMKMLSPIIPLAYEAPSAIRYTFTAGPGYDYEKQSLKGLIYDKRRNDMIVDIAAKAIRIGSVPIISCIPGDDMAHPQLIADALSEQQYVDTNGRHTHVRAVAITSRMSGKARQDVYHELETGSVHALAYIDVLNEGWDSLAANVLVNARPTRSLLSARQRVGRILRPKRDNTPAIAIDIIDSISSRTTPPAIIADVLKRKSLKTGEYVGDPVAAFDDKRHDFIDQLARSYKQLTSLSNEHTQFMEEIAKLPIAKRGVVTIKEHGAVTTYATARRLHDKLNVDDLFLEYAKRQGVEPRLARVGAQPEETYQESDIHDALENLPDAPRSGHYATYNGQEFMSAEDIVLALKSKNDKLVITSRNVATSLSERGFSDSDVVFTKHQWARTHTGRKLFKQRLLIEKSLAHDLLQRLSK